ncbi:MAG: M16 family metallopeptidase, partial [Bryobacteraceae bacterium]
NILVKAGSLDDPSGRTGLAHMFEHMAFKGTPQIGTKDWGLEKKAIDEVEEAYDRLEEERRKELAADPSRINSLGAQLKAAIDRAGLYAQSTEFASLVEENGGVGMNAGTSLESTSYTYSFPSNRLELWFFLESRRFLQPVYREFYKERDVVGQERQERIDSNPQGKLMEALLTTAFAAHPYRQMPGGWASDIANLTAADAQRFFRTYYVPGNMVAVIAGDVNPADVRRLADKYFVALPKGPLPPRVTTVEPRQQGERRVAIESPAQPMMFVGYKRPDQRHPDDPVFDVITTILASGRTGTLYKEMVRDRKLALAAVSAPTFPGGRYPNLFVFLMVPAIGRTMEENEKTFYEILEKFKQEKPDKATLERVKVKTRAALIQQLANNGGLASLLATYHVAYGGWRKMFTAIEDVNKVTAEDVQRVAKEYFIDTGKTVAFSVQPKAGGAK